MLVLLALLLLVSPASAGTSWKGPSCDTLGVRLSAWSYVERPGRSPGGIVYDLVENRPDLLWLCFGLDADTSITWPWHRVPVLYQDSLRVAAVVACAVTPPLELAPVPLGRLDPGRLWRLRYHGKGKVLTVLFAGFPRGRWDPDKVDRLRLEPIVP